MAGRLPCDERHTSTSQSRVRSCGPTAQQVHSHPICLHCARACTALPHMPHATQGATPPPCRSSRPFASSRAAPARPARAVAVARPRCVFGLPFCFPLPSLDSLALFLARLVVCLLSFGQSCFAPSGAIAVPAPARPARPPSHALAMCWTVCRVSNGVGVQSPRMWELFSAVALALCFRREHPHKTLTHLTTQSPHTSYTTPHPLIIHNHPHQSLYTTTRSCPNKFGMVYSLLYALDALCAY